MSQAIAEAARKALSDPEMVVEINAKQVDSKGEDTGYAVQHLTIASVPVGQNRIYYGSVQGESNPFTIAPESFELLSVDLFSFD